MDKKMYAPLVILLLSFLILPALVLMNRSEPIRPSDHYTALCLAQGIMEEALSSSEQIYSREIIFNRKELKRFSGELRIIPLVHEGNFDNHLIRVIVNWQIAQGNVVDKKSVSLISVKGSWP